MRKFILAIIVLMLSVFVGLKLSSDPGLALFSYQDWLVQMPLWFAIISFLAILFILYGLLRFLDSIDTSFYRCKNWLRWRKKNKAFSKTNRGLLELIEGDWINAENDLMSSIDQSDAPLINYLASAKAAHERKAYDKRDIYLRLAYDIAPQASLAIGITQARLQFNQGQLEQALATLNHLKQTKPYHPVVLKLLERIYIHLSDWQSLLTLLPSLRKAHVLSLDQYENLEEKIYEEILKSSLSKRSSSMTSLQEIWQKMPGKLQKNAKLLACYTSLMIKHRELSPELDDLINKALKKNWNADLVKLYGFLETKQTNKQVARAEEWLKKYPKQPILLLTLGRLCARLQLWGKARAYFEESILLEPHPDTYYEYGELLEKLDDTPLANQQYKHGLQLLLNQQLYQKVG